jgi:hypothetical protein
MTLLLLPVIIVPILVMVFFPLALGSILTFFMFRQIPHQIPWLWIPEPNQMWWVAGAHFLFYTIVLLILFFRYRKELFSLGGSFKNVLKEFFGDSILDGNEYINLSHLWPIVIFWPLIYGLSYAIEVYVIGKFFELAESPWADLVIFEHMWISGFFIGTLVTLTSGVLIGWDLCKSRRSDTRTKGIAILSLTFSIVYGVYSTVYAGYIYPSFPHFLGGGKPFSAVIWVEKDHVLPDIKSELPKARFHDTKSKYVRFENIYILFHDSKTIVLTDREYGPGVGLILTRDSINVIRSPKMIEMVNQRN